MGNETMHMGHDMPIDPKRYMARTSPVYMNDGREKGDFISMQRVKLALQ